MFKQHFDYNDFNINQAKERIKNGIYFADTCIDMIKLNKDLT